MLQNQLHQAGVETAGAATPPEQTARLRITLAEDAHGWLLVAEVSIGDRRQVVMLPWNPVTATQEKPRITITKNLLWTQSQPILDILLVDSGSGMLVLGLDQIASYRMAGGKWIPSAILPLALLRPMPRDPRGRLEASANGFRAYLPAGTCSGSWMPDLALTCRSGTATWESAAVHWVADRNTLESDNKPPFYTMAAGLVTPSAVTDAWGSDIAGVADPCGAGTAVIASSPNNAHDEIRVYEIANGQPVPESDAAALPGPETALWPAESGRDATLVVHDLQTGEYEGSRLGLACSE